MESLSQLLAHLALDLVAVAVLTFAVYFPRHRRRDLLPAYLALNVALFAVVAALARVGGSGGMALGFGLFGVLSMIRLRSESIQNEEVAYYFTTLVVGLVAGLPHLPFGYATALCALPVAVLYGADHPRLFARTRRTVVTLDVAVTEPDAIREGIRVRLGEPLAWSVTEVDYVRDLTVLDVRYRESAPSPGQAVSSTCRGGLRGERAVARQERSAPAVRSQDSDSTPPSHTAAHMRETAR